jgi:hypothetical protein
MSFVSNLKAFIQNFEIDNRDTALFQLGVNLDEISTKVRLIGKNVHVHSGWSFCGVVGALLYNSVSSSPDKYELFFFIDEGEEVEVSKSELIELFSSFDWKKSAKRNLPSGSSATCIFNDFRISFCSKDLELGDSFKLDSIILCKQKSLGF